MFFYNGLSCPVCGQPFHANEDIVACPQCGLPHHRHCWQQEGRCHLAPYHGTDQQWNRPDDNITREEIPDAAASGVAVCPRCHTQNPEFAEFCQRCGMPLQQNDWHSGQNTGRANAAGVYGEYKPFSSPAAEPYSPNDYIDDVSAEQLAAIVGNKKAYYIPRFRQIARTGAGGWNWAAFFFGPYWLLYRRMYLSGSLLLLLDTVYTFLESIAMTRLGMDTSSFSTIDVTTLDRSQQFYLLSIFLITVIMLVIRILIARFANRFYKQHCVCAIKKAQERVPDISTAELSQIGGASFTIAVIGYVARYVITQILAIFLL